MDHINAPARVDTITKTASGVSASGFVANKLLQSGFNVNSLRTNDVLRKQEWVLYDTALLAVARYRMVGIQDLIGRGFRYPLANALGITRLEWETVTEMTGADMTMSGLSESDGDRVSFALTGLPIPIVHKDFNLNIRVLESSRRTGQPLDTTMVERATRKVAERIETMLFLGDTSLGANNTIYGFNTAPSRQTGSMSNSHKWDTDSTGADMLADVLAMIQKLVAKNMYGPYGIYCTQAAAIRMADDFKTYASETIMQRLSAVPNISFIRPAYDVPANTAIMFQLSRDVIDIIDGMQPTLVQWDSPGGFVTNFKVMAIMLPRMRVDAESQSGVVIYS